MSKSLFLSSMKNKGRNKGEINMMIVRAHENKIKIFVTERKINKGRDR